MLQGTHLQQVAALFASTSQLYFCVQSTMHAPSPPPFTPPIHPSGMPPPLTPNLYKPSPIRYACAKQASLEVHALPEQRTRFCCRVGCMLK